MAKHGQVDTSSRDTRLLIMKMIVKICDICNVTRPLEDQKLWTAKLTQEFFLQG